MTYFFQVWTKPRMFLTPVDEFVMGIEATLLIVLLAVAWVLLHDAYNRVRKAMP